MDDLFLRSNLTFEKHAADVAMPPDPSQWPQEVIQELFKQLPFIHDFSPHVEFIKVDGEKGYGFGYITATPASEAQLSTTPGAMAASGLKQVKIPVIIKQNQLKPLDLVVTAENKMWPLTDERLREALFRPQAFDVTSQTPGDQSMIAQLYPPYRQNYGFGGGGVAMSIGMGKEGAAKKASGNKFTSIKERSHPPKPLDPDAEGMMVMASIRHTLNESDVQDFQRVLQDPEIKLAYQANVYATKPIVTAILTTPIIKLANVERFVKPNVVQLSKHGSHYLLKTASSKFWEPTETILSRSEALQKCGEKFVFAADLSGAVTQSEPEAVEELPESPTSQPITNFGTYTVHTTDGEQLNGFVFTNLYDAEGKKMPLSLFTDGKATAIQTDIVGSPSTEHPQLAPSEPNGYGFFFSAEAEATIPFYIKASYHGVTPGEDKTFVAESFDGRPAELVLSQQVQIPIGSEEGRLILPASWQFLPMSSTQQLALESQEQDVVDKQEAKEASKTIKIAASRDGTTYSIHGLPVEKIASNNLDMDNASFILGALGVDLPTAFRKMAHAIQTGKHIPMRVGRSIKLANEIRTQTKLASAAYHTIVPNLRKNLIKEAAVVTDPTAVDTVLSIGFINPDNVDTFLQAIPQLEVGLNRLCELLVATRLGLNEIPEVALEKCVKSVEDVIRGLKALAFQGTDVYSEAAAATA